MMLVETQKFCVTGGNTATKEALFNVDGAVLIEKYCDICAERERKVIDWSNKTVIL
jgi:hypothetical protein